jgi:hypothetical protein
MKIIINKYHKRLTFPDFDFSIDANEIKTVSDSIRDAIISNKYIEDVSFKKDEIKPIEKVEIKTKKVKKTK